MSTANFLYLNVDTLFEQHSVPEVDIIQKKIQGVVENKKEKLRITVGERYRDLLQAADTIVSMQTSANTLISQISQIISNCRSLNDQQLIGFKSNDTSELLIQRQTNKELSNYFSCMVQIKLLTTLPEMIWSKIEREQFYAATEFFIFSRHISTGLQLDTKNTFMQHMPIVKKQCEILKPLHFTIKQCISSVLDREDLNAEVASDCLLSLLLLENNNFNGVIKTFLNLRCLAFSTCLTKSSLCSETEIRGVKERILGSLRVLYGTMEMISKCFVENGLLFQKFQNYLTTVAPTISYMDEASYAHMLPEIIAKFRPKLDVQQLDRNQVANEIKQWLIDTRQIANVQLKNLFGLVSDMRSIQEIKTKANDIIFNLDLSTIVVYFGLKQHIRFYEMEYLPLINQRVREIIEQNLAETMELTFSALEKALPNVMNSEYSMWPENSQDLPLSLEMVLTEKLNLKNLLMRTQGYDKEIIEFCSKFDQQLASIVGELNVLFEEGTGPSEDQLALVQFLQEATQNQLNNLLRKLKDLEIPRKHRKQLLIIVRSCTALVDLCPHLKICFCQQVNLRHLLDRGIHQAASSSDHWQRMSLFIENEMIYFWSEIVDSILEEYNCGIAMPQVLTDDIILEDFVFWEFITIKDEQNNPVTSSFRVPTQPRISLQCFLFGIVSLLNTTVPETLPSKILHICINKLLANVLTLYESYSAHSSSSINQYVALQLYFDLKFLQSIFQVSREERGLNEKFQKLQKVFRDLIDPFDFELFSDQISFNVKRCVSRLSCQLGVLVPQLTSITTNTVLQENDPNILSLSTNTSTSIWFPLLPIVLRSSSVDGGRNVRTERALEVPTPKLAPEATSMQPSPLRKNNDFSQKGKSNTTSFFGAMSQEWFR